MESDERIAPFLEAVSVTLREMAGVDSFARVVESRTEPEPFGELSAMLPIRGNCEGCLMLSFSTRGASELAERVLGGAAEADDATIRDCLGEVANVVAGQAKTLLYGTPDHFLLGTPTVTTGPAANATGDWRVAAFASDLGEFRLQVRFPNG